MKALVLLALVAFQVPAPTPAPAPVPARVVRARKDMHVGATARHLPHGAAFGVGSERGARTVAQFEDNLKALDVTISPEHQRRLDEVSAPTPIFPHSFLPGTASVMQAGTEINGQGSAPWPLAPAADHERW